MDSSEGTYQIAVNYYSGSLPEMANVQLTLGDGSIPPARQVYLAQSFGSAGNSTPILVWEIDVEIDELGRVSYTVY